MISRDDLPDTPDWTPAPHASPFDALMAGLADHMLDAPTWENPGDLSRVSIQAMQRKSAARRPVLDTEDHIERGSN